MSNSKLPISLVIITLNEASGIARAIRSASFCEDIVVLDSGSSDETVKIARELGARVVEETREAWRGFTAQKQYATDLAKHDWVLSLDGDEALSNELRLEIIALAASPTALARVDGYRSPRMTWNLGRWIRHGGWYPDWQLRFFHRGRAKWIGGQVHERVDAAKIESLKGAILHYPFARHDEQVATNNRYSGLGAEALKAKGEKFRFHKLLVKPVSKFLETYVIKRGFLDGLAGFVISVGASYSIFLKYAKLWEIEKFESGEWGGEPPAPDQE
ncbi:MAG: glycosyltransferase family 2 protein [Bdellovibrionales bacterium]|nr:glycosyltransferase family 2 protein [Bdellovibrionales bacterium]